MGGLFTAGAFSMTGASVGVMLGANAFAPKQTIPSSTGDLKAQVAEPTFLPIVCGGNIPDEDVEGQETPGGVWLPGKIIKTPKEGGITVIKGDSDGQGGTAGRMFGESGGGDGDRHLLNVQVAWCEGSTEHPQELYELRADDKVMFRLGALENEEGYLERTFLYDVNGVCYGWQSDKIRHYYGTGTQKPDDVVATWWDGGIAPAHRGVSHTVIINHQIDTFGHVPTYFGRLGNGITSRIEQARFYLKRANGLDGEVVIPDSAIRLSKISGYSRGWYMTQYGSPCAIAGLVAARADCALVEHSGCVWDVDLKNPTIHELENWELAAELEGGDEDAPTRYKRGVQEDVALASRVEGRFTNARKRDEDTVSAVMPTAHHENVMSVDMPTVDVPEKMAAWFQGRLNASWVGRTPGEVSVLPRRIDIFPGDVVRVPVRSSVADVGALAIRPYRYILVRERSLATPGAIRLKGTSWSPNAYDDIPDIVPDIEPVEATGYAAPVVFVSNSVSLSDAMLQKPGCVFAACQTPNFKWGDGVVFNIDQRTGTGPDDWNEIQEFNLTEQAVMGQIRSSWTVPGPYDGYVSDNPLEVGMFNGELITTTEELARGGANTILFENGLVLSFAVALQTGLTSYGTGEYELSYIKAGRWGSDDLVSRETVIPAGSRFILISDENGKTYRDNTIHFQSFNIDKLGKTMRVRGNMIEKPKIKAFREFTFQGRNIEPLAPVAVRTARDEGGAFTLWGRARTRDISQDSWTSSYIGATEPRRAQGYAYQVQLSNGAETVSLTMYAQDDGAAFSWTWSETQLIALFGSLPSAITGTVAMQGSYGLGRQRLF